MENTISPSKSIWKFCNEDQKNGEISAEDQKLSFSLQLCSEDESSPVKRSSTTDDQYSNSQPSPKKKKALGMDKNPMPQVLNDMEDEIERQLDSKAEKTNLTVINVKNILKSVITNEDVMAMVRQSLHEQGEGFDVKCIYEPKLTRAKAKELLKLQPQSTSLWPMTPVKQSPSKSECQVLIQQELPEDSSDEEYNPVEDDQSDEDDDKNTSSVTSDVDSSPATPVYSSANVSFDENNTVWSQDGVFKIPPENIGQRTRSKLCLSDTPLEAIEQAFIPPDITTDMYEWGCDNDDWKNFLQEFSKPLDSEPAIVDDTEEDPEYNVLADEEEEVVDKEELRMDRAVKVSRKELNELMAELFEYTENVMHQSNPSDDEEDSKPEKPQTDNSTIFNDPNYQCLSMGDNIQGQPSTYLQSCDSLLQPTISTYENVDTECHSQLKCPLKFSSQTESVKADSPIVRNLLSYNSPQKENYSGNGNEDNFIEPASSKTLLSSNQTPPSTPVASSRIPHTPAALSGTPQTPSVPSRIPQTPATLSRTPQTPSVPSRIPQTPAALSRTPQTPSVPSRIPHTPAALSRIPPTPALIRVPSTPNNKIPPGRNAFSPLDLNELCNSSEAFLSIDREKTPVKLPEQPSKIENVVPSTESENLSDAEVKDEHHEEGLCQEQILLLNQQMRQHIQLTTQHFLQCYQHPDLSDLAEKCKTLLVSIETSANDSNLGNNSAFNAANLKSALKVVKAWESLFEVPSVRNSVISFVKKMYWKYVGVKKKLNKSEVPDDLLFPPPLLEVVSASKAFMYPLLLPPVPFFKRKDTIRKFFSLAEERLVVYGIDTYSDVIKQQVSRFSFQERKWDILPLIIKNLVPTGDVTSLRFLIQRKRQEKESNPIRDYYKDAKLPHLVHYVIPIEEGKTLFQQLPDLLPGVWKNFILLKKKQAAKTAFHKTL